jgi:hypothetical protein
VGCRRRGRRRRWGERVDRAARVTRTRACVWRRGWRRRSRPSTTLSRTRRPLPGSGNRGFGGGRWPGFAASSIAFAAATSSPRPSASRRRPRLRSWQRRSTRRCGATWATRKHCHIDRAACAWLIRRFLAPRPGRGPPLVHRGRVPAGPRDLAGVARRNPQGRRWHSLRCARPPASPRRARAPRLLSLLTPFPRACRRRSKSRHR